jgi:hypothetical protein
MNKKELVKLLFKHPTIKALYESPEFDSRMINQVILSEASSVLNLSDDADQTVKKAEQDTKQQGDADKTTTQQQPAKQDNETNTLKQKIQKEAEYFDKIVSEDLSKKLGDFLRLKGVENSIPLFKAFLINYFNETGVHTLSEKLGQLPELDSKFKSFIEPLSLNDQVVKNLLTVASDPNFNSISAKIRDDIQAKKQSSSQDTNLEQEKEKYLKRAAMAVRFLNVEDNELFSDDNFMAFLGKVLEKEGVIQEQGEEGEDYATKYLAELQSSPADFLLTPEEARSLIQTLANKKEEVNKIIKAAIQASKQSQTDADTKDAIGDATEADPDADADVSPMEQEKLDEEWIRTLDIFFGKNPQSPSFMRRLLLKDQATMLFTMIDTLKKIELGKSADGEERSLTNQRGEFDSKDEQPTSNKEVDNSQQQTQATGDTPAEQAKGSLQESLINEIFNKLFKSDNQEIKISKKTTAFMRQDLESMVNLLQSLKADIKGYERFATRSSSDPRYDGTTLKAAMDGKLETTQKSIAHLIKVIDVEIQNQINQLGKDAQQVARGDTLQEDRASDRKLRIEEVEKVYNELRRMYLKGLRISLENPDTEEAKAGAKQMREYVMGQEKFMSYFPTNIISGGKVMTLGDAYEKMSVVIRKFIETIRDIVTITKTQRVSKTDLEVVVADLVAISLAIQSTFRKESLIDSKFMENYKNEIAQNPDKQSLTNKKPAENLGLAGKGLEKLKKMFGWMSEETLKLLSNLIDTPDLPIFEPMIKAIDLTQKSDDWKNTAIQDASQAAMWFNRLEKEEQQALTIYGKYLLDNEAIISEDSAGRNAFYGAMNTAGVRFQDGKGTRKAFKKAYKAVKAVKKKGASMAKAIDNLMTNHKDNLVKFFTFTISNPDLATDLFKLLEELPEASIQPSSEPPGSPAAEAPNTDGGESDALPPGSVEIEDEENQEEDTQTPSESSSFDEAWEDSPYHHELEKDGIKPDNKEYEDIKNVNKIIHDGIKERVLSLLDISQGQELQEASNIGKYTRVGQKNIRDKFKHKFHKILKSILKELKTRFSYSGKNKKIVKRIGDLIKGYTNYNSLSDQAIQKLEDLEYNKSLGKINRYIKKKGTSLDEYLKWMINPIVEEVVNLYYDKTLGTNPPPESSSNTSPGTENQEDKLNNGWAKDKKEDFESSDIVPDIEEEKSKLIQKGSEEYQNLKDEDKWEIDMDNSDFEYHYFNAESNEKINLEQNLKQMEFTESDGKKIIDFTTSIIQIVREKRKEKNIQKEAAFSKNPNGSPFKSLGFGGASNVPYNPSDRQRKEEEYKNFQKKELKTILKNLKYFLKTNGIEDEIKWPTETTKAMKIIHKYYGKNNHIYDMIAKYIAQELEPEDLEEVLKPIIEKMLKEHYNY